MMNTPPGRVGCDLLAITRIQRILRRYGPRFAEKVLTEAERLYCKNRTERLASTFAAKEAVSKALGTGFLRSGIHLRDIEILRSESGEPYVSLHGRAAERLCELGGGKMAVSLSHDAGLAMAVVWIYPSADSRI